MVGPQPPQAQSTKYRTAFPRSLSHHHLYHNTHGEPFRPHNPINMEQKVKGRTDGMDFPEWVAVSDTVSFPCSDRDTPGCALSLMYGDK